MMADGTILNRPECQCRAVAPSVTSAQGDATTRRAAQASGGEQRLAMHRDTVPDVLRRDLS